MKKKKIFKLHDAVQLHAQNEKKTNSTELFERTKGPFTNRAHGSYCASKCNEKDQDAWMCLTFELF